MKSRTVLLQWIGHSDLRAMAGALPTVKQRQLLDRIGGDASQAGDLGPTKTLLTTQHFDEPNSGRTNLKGPGPGAFM